MTVLLSVYRLGLPAITATATVIATKIATIFVPSVLFRLMPYSRRMPNAQSNFIC